MSGPMFELPNTRPPKPPFPGGWMMLGLILAFIVFAQLLTYFGRSAKGSTALNQAEESFKEAVYVYESAARILPAGKAAGSPDSPGNKAAEEERKRNKQRFMDVLDDVANKLSGSLKTDPSAALLFAAIRTEQGYIVKPESVAVLKSSKDPVHRAAYELYAAPGPSPERARELAALLKGKRFGVRMARIQALEKTGDTSVRTAEFPTGKLMLVGLVSTAQLHLLAAGGVLLVSYAIQSRKGLWKPLGHPAGKLNPVQADQNAMRAFLLLLVFLFVGEAVRVSTKGVLNNAGQALVAGVLLVLCAATILKLPLTGPALSLKDVGIGMSRFFANAVWGAAGFAANMPLLLIALQLSNVLFSWLPAPEHPLTQEFTTRQDALSWAAYFGTAVILAPIFEEIAFRGVLLPALESLLGTPARAIIVSSLLFGMIHPTGIPAWLPLAAVGATCAMLTYQTRSLVPAILLHMAHNLGLLVLQIGMS